MDVLMAAVRLHWAIRSAGGWLRVNGGIVRINGPADLMTAELDAAVRTAKPALVRLFTEPCPCATCAALAEEPPAPRLYCASGLDTDPAWEALRREFDALDEADERAAIQAVEGP
jgi:hypothetical protein